MHTITIWKRGNECNMGNFLSKWRHWLTSETVCEQNTILVDLSLVIINYILIKKKVCIGSNKYCSENQKSNSCFNITKKFFNLILIEQKNYLLLQYTLDKWDPG